MYKRRRVDASARRLVKLGAILLALAAAGSMWFVLSSQSPESFWYVGTLPEPVERFASSTAFVGFGVLFAAWLLPQVARTDGSARRLEIALHVGGSLFAAASWLAAMGGGYGVQLGDSRPRSVAITSVRLAAMVVLGAVLAIFVVRLLTRKGDR